MLPVLACKTAVIYLLLFVLDFCFCSRASVDNALLDLLNSDFISYSASFINYYHYSFKIFPRF